MQAFFYKSLFFTFLYSIFCFPSALKAQKRDSIKPDTLVILESELPKHSPTRASIYSALVPGLGQVYNKKYLKVPFIWAGIAIPMYYGLQQHSLFDEKRSAYKNRLAGDSSDIYLQPGNFFTNDGLLESMDVNRRNRDLMYIIAGTIYFLQILDASVDAHLFYFNVSDDLSLNYSPMLYYDNRIRKPVQGLSLSLEF